MKFLLSLTDPRVKLEKAPFDRPEIFVPIDGAAPENTGGPTLLAALSGVPCPVPGPGSDPLGSLLPAHPGGRGERQRDSGPELPGHLEHVRFRARTTTTSTRIPRADQTTHRSAADAPPSPLRPGRGRARGPEPNVGDTDRRPPARAGAGAAPLALLALVLALLRGSSPCRARGAPPTAPIAKRAVANPEILARVNGEPVTRSEWQRLLQSPFERGLLLDELGVPEPDHEALGSPRPAKLIHRRLLLQEAAPARDHRDGAGARRDRRAAAPRRFGDLDASARG